MTFNPTDAAMEGFRLVRRQPMIILWWVLAYVAFFVAVVVCVGGPVLAMIPQLQAAESNPTPEAFSAITGLYGLVLLVVLPLSILVGAVLNTAVARAVLSPGESRFGYLRIGKDELRVAVVTLVIALLFSIGIVAAVIAVIVLGAIGKSINDAAAMLLGMIGGLAVFCAAIFVAVRWSLAVPITYAEKRIAIFDSFALTKGRFWPMLGMTLLVAVLAIAVYLLGTIISLPFQMMGGAGFDSAVEAGDAARVMTSMGPLLLVSVVIQLIMSALQLPVMYAPYAAAYRAIKGEADGVPPTAA